MQLQIKFQTPPIKKNDDYYELRLCVHRLIFKLSVKTPVILKPKLEFVFTDVNNKPI